LRALPVPQMRDNFAQMIDLSTREGAKVLVLGMRIPPNYGPQYTSQFEAVYGDLARADKLPLVPFLMDHIALQPELMQGDDIHPNVKGQPILLDNVWAVLRPMLRK
jgi:acyl-CoA thioesterase-1